MIYINKNIDTLYLIGSSLRLLIRAEFNRSGIWMITRHAFLTFLFFIVTPFIIGGFRNFLIPLKY